MWTCYSRLGVRFSRRQNNEIVGPQMKKTTTRIISVSLLSLAASAAFAKGDGGDHQCRGDGRSCWSAPEIDPAQALGALVLVSGAVAIVRGRRRKK
jgi:hypothetical protein